VLAVLEYAAPVWPELPQGPVVTSIKRIGAATDGTPPRM
jgi:hypothetical protein